MVGNVTNTNGINMKIQSPLDLWHRLTKPDDDFSDATRRRQSILLNQVLLIVIFVLLSAGIITTIQDVLMQRSFTALPTVIPTIIITVLAYRLNRRNYYLLSATLLVLSGYAAVLGITIVSERFFHLFYLAPTLLIAAMFISKRHMQILGGITVVGGLVFGIVYQNMIGDTDYITAIAVMNYLLVTTPVILTYMDFRYKVEKERRAELEQAVVERTMELEAARQETQTALERALEADQLKSQFLASMSHELRTPLNSILTFNELMMMGTFGEVNEEQVDYLGKSLESGRHLLSLVNDVLDITKIQSGMMKLFVENDFDVSHEVASVAATAQNLLQDKPVDLITDIDDGFPPLTCDKRRVRQVMLNLISNAIKFTERGTITISAKHLDDHLLFAIQDTGPGIPEDQHQVIFEPFVQTEEGIKHAAGTGLGLPISKRLVEAHGGRLWVESTPDDGAAFYATFPLNTPLALGETEM